MPSVVFIVRLRSTASSIRCARHDFVFVQARENERVLYGHTKLLQLHSQKEKKTQYFSFSSTESREREPARASLCVWLVLSVYEQDTGLAV